MKKVLVVEDDYIIQMFITKVLERMGIEVVGPVCSSELVMKALDYHKPHLVLMDVGINGNNDGVEISHLINKKYKVPIVYITGNSDKKTKDRALKTNPLGFLFKPFDEDDLEKMMRNSLLALEATY